MKFTLLPFQGLPKSGGGGAPGLGRGVPAPPASWKGKRTKVVVVILIVFAVGAVEAFRQPHEVAPADPQKDAKSHKPAGFEQFLAGLSLPTGTPNPLKKSLYHAGDPAEVIPKAEKIRQVKLRITSREGCVIPIDYTDNAPHDPVPS